MHPFTGIEITDKGLAWMSDWVGQVRDVIGMEIPLSAITSDTSASTAASSSRA